MSTEFLVSKEVELPESPSSNEWVDTSEAISQLREEVQRLRRNQPVQTLVENHDLPVDLPSDKG